MELPPHSRIQESPHRVREDRANPEARACGIEVMWQASDIGHTPTQLNSTHTSRQSSSIALLFSSFLLHWLRSTRDPRRHTRRERERHTHARGELAYTPILAPLHYMVEEMGTSRAMPCLCIAGEPTSPAFLWWKRGRPRWCVDDPITSEGKYLTMRRESSSLHSVLPHFCLPEP